MTEVSRPQQPASRRAMGSGAAVLIAVAGLLWFEMREPGLHVWNVLLAALLLLVVAAGVVLQRFFIKNLANVGEARFDTRNETNVKDQD